MTSRILHGVVLGALVCAPIGVHAQFGSLLKKKAEEVLKGRTAPAEPRSEPARETAPAPAPTSTPATPAPRTSPASTHTTAQAAATATPADPLDLENFRLEGNAINVLRDDRPGQLPEAPSFGKATNAALKALDDAGRVAFVQKAGAALKALVTSETFASAHAEAIKRQYKAVDHGLKVASPEQMMKKGDFATYEAFSARQRSANIVEAVERQSAAEIKRTLPFQLDMWRGSAKTATGKYKAKYERLVKDSDALLAMSDEVAVRRAYAVLRSIDGDGPDTEAALYAQAEQGRKEEEQVAWDTHNLKSVLKQQLNAFTALVPTVDFAAKTVDRNGRQVFVTAAHERQGSLWKACYRAGKPATTAVQQWAQAWLKEL